MRHFFFLDLEASFGAGGTGAANQTLIDRCGDARLGRMAWKIGNEAYSRLRGPDGAVSVGDIERFISESERRLNDFVEELIELHKRGRIEMACVNGAAADVDYASWREADMHWKMDTEIRVIHAAQQDLDAPGNFAGPQALLVALGYLEHAVASSVLQESDEEVADCLLQANWFLTLVTNEELIDAAERKKLSERAKAGHARSPKRAAKNFVRECWMAWEESPSQYKSVAHFARAMVEKFPDTLATEVTVTRWVRGWRGESK